MNDELDQMKPSELDKVFALEVAGWTEFKKREDCSFDGPGQEYWMWRTGHGVEVACPHRFSSDANAVMPYLNGFRAFDWSHDEEERAHLNGGVCVALVNGPAAYALTFARAACLALIRAARASR